MIVLDCIIKHPDFELFCNLVLFDFFFFDSKPRFIFLNFCDFPTNLFYAQLTYDFSLFEYLASWQMIIA